MKNIKITYYLRLKMVVSFLKFGIFWESLLTFLLKKFLFDVSLKVLKSSNHLYLHWYTFFYSIGQPRSNHSTVPSKIKFPIQGIIWIRGQQARRKNNLLIPTPWNHWWETFHQNCFQWWINYVYVCKGLFNACYVFSASINLWKKCIKTWLSVGY